MIKNMVTTTNLKYANSSSNYYIIMMVQNLQKKFKIENFQIFSNSGGTKCQFNANNHFAVVVCAKYVVKRPSKRSARVYTSKTQLNYMYVCIH